MLSDVLFSDLHTCCRHIKYSAVQTKYSSEIVTSFFSIHSIPNKSPDDSNIACVKKPLYGDTVKKQALLEKVFNKKTGTGHEQNEQKCIKRFCRGIFSDRCQPLSKWRTLKMRPAGRPAISQVVIVNSDNCGIILEINRAG